MLQGNPGLKKACFFGEVNHFLHNICREIHKSTAFYQAKI